MSEDPALDVASVEPAYGQVEAGVAGEQPQRLSIRRRGLAGELAELRSLMHVGMDREAERRRRPAHSGGRHSGTFGHVSTSS